MAAAAAAADIRVCEPDGLIPSSCKAYASMQKYVMLLTASNSAAIILIIIK